MKKIRIAAATAALALILSLGTPALAYSDTDGHWAEEYITTATDRGLFAGVGEDRFAPEATMSRAMAVTVLWRFVGKPGYESDPDFSDVTAGTWYDPAIRWAARCEIVTGDGDGRFRPDEPVTREELVTMMLRALMQQYPALFAGQLSTPEFYAANWLEYTNANFTDGWSGGEWAAAALGWAVSTGIFEGDDDGLLRPGDDLTRAEAAAVFCRAFERYGEYA